MAVAMIYPETQQGKRGTSLKIKDLNEGYVSQARAVLAHSRSLAESVRAGAKALSDIHRRHMSKGQRAMAVAMIYPEAEKGGRGKKSATNSEIISGFSERSAHARGERAPQLL